MQHAVVNFYVQMSKEQVRRLDSELKVRFRLYGRVGAFSIERNDVIEYGSVGMHLPDNLFHETRERVMEYVTGFIEGCACRSSFDPPECHKCDSYLDREGYCVDETCIYSNWPQHIPLFVLSNMPADTIENEYNVNRRAHEQKTKAP